MNFSPDEQHKIFIYAQPEFINTSTRPSVIAVHPWTPNLSAIN